LNGSSGNGSTSSHHSCSSIGRIICVYDSLSFDKFKHAKERGLEHEHI
jgi:hypothetical protein